MTTETSPTSRALLALELIQGSPGMTADRLADSLGITERAARRYVGVLREANIPIVSTRGPYGGYTVGRGVRLPPLMFSATEALAIVMAVLDGHHDAADPTNPVGSALGKIIRALPEGVARQAEAVRQATTPSPDRYAVHPDPARTALLVQAASSHHLVMLGYRTAEGAEWTSPVEPWAVIVRHGRWYLLCRRVTSDTRRTYRIDRVRSVEVLAEEFSPPADLDPVAMLEEQFGQGWEYPTEVIIERPAEEATRWLSRAVGRIEPVDEHSCRLVGTTGDPYYYVEHLAALPVPFRIIGGPELRAATRAVAQRMLAATFPA